MPTLTLEEYRALSREELVRLNHSQYGTIGGTDPVGERHQPGRKVVIVPEPDEAA